MSMIPTLFAILVFFAPLQTNVQAPQRFMGRKITIIHPDREGGEEGIFFPKGPAIVCVEGPPRRQCYTAPKDFGNDPQASVVHLKKGMDAILFSAATGGVSGWGIHFALLRAGKERDLEDSFMSEVKLSEQSQHAFWSVPSISDSLIFLTADYAWGPEEAHHGGHRFIVSAYVWKQLPMLDYPTYYLDDQYMTVRKYDVEEKADVLAAEKQEIIARLKRLSTKP
jgi:hypothetical protein